MAKPEIKQIRSGYDEERLQENFEAVASYIEDHLVQRIATQASDAPIETDLDMNGYKINHVAYATDPNDAVPIAQALELLSGDFSSLG